MDRIQLLFGFIPTFVSFSYHKHKIAPVLQRLKSQLQGISIFETKMITFFLRISPYLKIHFRISCKSKRLLLFKQFQNLNLLDRICFESKLLMNVAYLSAHLPHLFASLGPFNDAFCPHGSWLVDPVL